MVKSLLYAAFLTAILAAAALGQFQQQPVVTTELPHSSFDFGWGGARAEGMGNAYLGLADDITAGAWNPAGLVGFEGPMLGVSWGTTRPRGFTDYTVESNLWRTDHSGSLSDISGLYFVGPFRFKGHALVGSVSYTRNFENLMGLGYNVQVEELFAVIRHNIFVWDTLSVDVGVRELFEGGVSTVVFSLGTRINETSSVGLGVNIYTGESTMETDQVAIVEEFPIQPGEQLVRLNNSTLVVDTAQFSGVNFTFAYKRTSERLNLGFVLRTPFDLNLNTNRSIYNLTSFNGLPIEFGTDTTFFDNQLTKYTMPWTIASGAAYSFGDNLVVTMDAEWRRFSSLKYKRRDSLFIDPAGNNEEFYTDIDPEWNSTFSLRFGSEYRKSTSIGTIPIRAGFGLVPIAWPNDTESESPEGALNFPHLLFRPLVKALNNDETPIMYTFSAGTGIHWSQIMLDWAYTYSAVDRNWGTDFANAQVRDHHLGFTFTGVF